MQPPKGKGIGVLIAVGKPKDGPPPLRGPDEKDDMPMRGRQPMQQQDQPDEEATEHETTITPADVDYSEDDLCESCANMGEDGNCRKYKFPVKETGHCEAGYEPREQGGGADYGSDQGGADQYGSEGQEAEGQY